MSSRELSYVDLFAGAGGLSTGLENAGFDLVHAVEIDDDARETFAHNRAGLEPSDLSGDIREIDTSDIAPVVGREQVDLVVGGPPCQGFSEVVSPDGSDDRNHLFHNFVDWVAELDPDAVLFENVRGMQKTAGGKFLTAVTESFGRLGYDVSHRVVRSSDFGVPQHRRRLIVIASKTDLSQNPFDGFEIDPVGRAGVVDGIGDLPAVAPGEEVNEYAEQPQTALQRDLRGDTDELTAHVAAAHSDEMVEMVSHIPDGGDRTAIPDELQPSSGYHNSYSRLQSDEPAVAITSNMSKPSSARCIHPFQDRGLTPREGARLQTFPDEYDFCGGLVSIRRQIGNAVPPYLGEALGYYLKRDLFGVGLSSADRHRIQLLRAGSLTTAEYERIDDEFDGFAKQATLDVAD